TANGELLFSTIHDGNVNLPAAEDDYAYTGAVTTDANGVIFMEAVPGEGTLTDQPFAFINALVLSAPVPTETDPSLVIYYSFDYFGRIVMDESGKGHDGVVKGNVTAGARGKFDGAANFARGSYLDLDGASFPAKDIPKSAITLATWINCENTGGHHEIFNARASDETWIIHPEVRSNGEFRWLLRFAGRETIFDIRAGSVTWDEWLHFAGTFDKESGKAILYINGEVVKEEKIIVVSNTPDIAGDWDLGARVGYTIDNARPFTGLMDEFRIYTRALSQDEILEIMQGM
ncbi:MAG: LamG domain-containing protein, partial [Planctomycetes bacterium]|nr:LamG domain-containing protein [Planctomycetota bacterium]